MHLPIRKLLTIALMLCAALAQGQAKTKKHASTKASTHSSKSTASAHSTSKHRHTARVKHGAWKHHGQQGIQPDRAMAIQKALIREKYLDGEPTGKWDDRTQHAMQRYQSDNQWQSKVTPDSRALIKLGLGPDHTADNRSLNLGNSADAVASTTPAARTATGNPNR